MSPSPRLLQVAALTPSITDNRCDWVWSGVRSVTPVPSLNFDIILTIIKNVHECFILQSFWFYVVLPVIPVVWPKFGEPALLFKYQDCTFSNKSGQL